MTPRDASAPTIVALHGVPLTPAVWDPVAAALGGLIAPDLRGERVADPLRRSERPGLLQRALADRVLSRLDGGPVHVIGHSFGGQVAIELALQLGGRLGSLTLLCTRDTPFPGFAALSDTVRVDGMPDRRSTLRRWFTADEIADASPAVAYAADCLRDADPDRYATALTAIAGYRPTGETAAVSAPVTVIAAGLDGVSPPEVMRAMSEGFADARLIVVDEWAHMSPFAAPDRLADLLVTAVGR
ncbi:alpha/beta fold hydrolase [Microbacterium sp. 179-I 3D3 NHS]|uniref:alpha/beta fold hydrolase n=1 Tax=Microbacterium sp. 179-I 3D3 NHS TaxID=3142382 RepID=UPI00399FB5B9